MSGFSMWYPVLRSLYNWLLFIPGYGIPPEMQKRLLFSSLSFSTLVLYRDIVIVNSLQTSYAYDVICMYIKKKNKFRLKYLSVFDHLLKVYFSICKFLVLFSHFLKQNVIIASTLQKKNMYENAVHNSNSPPPKANVCFDTEAFKATCRFL